jgi:hypothetical protein
MPGNRAPLEEETNVPGAYPPAAPTLSGDLLSISRFLQSPTALSRALRTIMNLRFVSDQLLTNQYTTSGGAISYEVSEPILNTRAVQAVAPGSEYPADTVVSGAAAIAAVSKWGEKSFLSDEKIKRSVYAGQEIARTLQKAVNTVVNKVEAITTSAISSAVTSTSSATASWSNTSATIFRDIEVAAAKIVDLNQGYNPDTVLMSTSKYALAVSDDKIATLRRRESGDNPIYGGNLETIGAFKVVYTSLSNLPSDDIWVLDSQQLGGMADEKNNDPGYTTIDRNIQVQTERVAGRDGFWMWARRLTVPLIQEPGAAIRITGS